MMLAAPPTAELLVSAPPDAIAWLRALYPVGDPRRLARMSEPGEMKPERDKKTKRYTGRMVPRDKYEDVYRTPFGQALHAHYAGDATYSCTVDKDGVTRLGVIDVDQGGRSALLACLEAARRLGVVAFAIEAEPTAHSGGHVVVIFADFVPMRSAEYLMRQIVKAAGLPEDTEIWPGSNQGVRILFGVHRQSGKRGNLITQAGEVVSLDDDLAAGVALVMALPMNGTPDAPPQASDKSDYTKPKSAPKPLPRVASAHQGTPSIIDRFNAENNLESLLGHYGGQRTAEGWACNCGVQHSHDTQLQLLDRGIVAYTTRCEWAPHYKSEKATDAFGLYCIVEHGGDKSAAVKALAIQYGVYKAAEPKVYRAPAQPEQRYSDEERAAYNAQRREKRHAETRAALEAIADGLEALDLSERASALAYHLIGLAHDGGALQVRPTNAQIVDALQMCERYVQYAFRELEAAKLGKRHGGRGGLDQPNEAAIWTFYRAPSLGCKPQQDAKCTLDYIEIDSIQSLIACEPAPQAPADSLETWQWCEAEYGAAELNALEWEEHNAPADAPAQTEPTPEPVLLPAEPPEVDALPAAFVQKSGPRYLAFDGTNYTWHSTKEAARLAAGLDQPPEVDAGGASYVGTPLIIDDPRAVPAWQRIPGDLAIVANPDAPEVDAPPAAFDLPEVEPVVRAPPEVDSPQYRNFIWRWNAAKQTTRTDAQRQRFRREAERLLVEVSATEAARRWTQLGGRGGAGGGPLTSKSAPIRPLAFGSRTGARKPPGAMQLALEDV